MRRRSLSIREGEHLMRRIVLATNNEHKASEISNMLDLDGIEVITLKQAGVMSDPVEDADSFEGNARIKALAAREALGNGLAVLADDSGLVVDALDGAPGVYSSRFAGEDGNDEANNALLLEKLSDVPDDKRTARFVCTLVFIDEDGNESVMEGAVEGLIAHDESGNEGFGYDPLFLPIEYGGSKTFAEVPQSEKNLISHRANAVKQLRELLQK